MMIYDVLVIGAGPSGMMAAMEAKTRKKELKIGILDSNSSKGKKLLITGGGRCNITNAQDIDMFFKYVVKNPKFLYSSFKTFTNLDLISFFEKNGLKLSYEGNKIYPLENNAVGVMDILEKQLRHLNVDSLLNNNICDIEVKNDYIELTTLESKKFYTKKLIIATGGASYKTTGSDGKMFEILRKRGLDISPLLPTLVKLNSNQESITKSQGISLNKVKFIVNHKNKKIAEVEDAVVFTHNGISGPAAINSSAYITDKDICDISIFIDFMPELSENEFKDILKNRDKKNLDTKISKFLPKELVKNILQFELGFENSVTENEIQNMKKNEMQKIINAFKYMNLKLTGYGGINESIVTRGGVSIKEINPKTLNLKKIPNIYVAGEMIDVDAFTGGFNLQIAFSTGYLAGKSASDEL